MRNETVGIWNRLKEETRPIVLYGMGNGAEKILKDCAMHGVTVRDIFASDEFVRGHSFAGFPVLRYSQIQQKYSDCVILLAFAAFQPELLQKIASIAQEYEVLAPDVPLFGEGEIDEHSLRVYEEEWNELSSILADDVSRNVLDCIIDYKLSGKIRYLRECETPREEIFEHIFSFGDAETFVDLGAYNGDTVEEFRQMTGEKYREIYALEPDPKNFAKLNAKVTAWGDSRIKPVACGAWSENTTLHFTGKGGRAACIVPEGVAVPVVSVDSLLNGARADYIKMDVEGAEREALFGCRRTIGQFRPKLAVSAYHRCNDFFQLPLLIHRMNPEYRIYLRHHPYLPAWETNVYAI